MALALLQEAQDAEAGTKLRRRTNNRPPYRARGRSISAKLSTSVAMTIDEEIQDEDLVRCIRQGDTNQFGLLAKRYASKIYGLAMRLMRNPADAEDGVQEAFLLVHTKLDSFRGESAFGSWLYKVALNSIYMKLRQRKHAPEANIDDYLPKFDGRGMMQGMVRKVGDGPEAEAIRQQSMAALQEAIERLPNDYRIVLVARDIDELSSEETAEALGLTGATVKSRLHRARLFLRQHLENKLESGASVRMA
jgi:RNA polymerase sigma-70 factor (ECF subfamily)